MIYVCGTLIFTVLHIPLCDQNTTHLSILLFQVFTNANNAAIKLLFMSEFLHGLEFLWGINLPKELLGHKDGHVQIHQALSHCFSKQLYKFIILPTTFEGFCCPNPHTKERTLQKMQVSVPILSICTPVLSFSTYVTQSNKDPRADTVSALQFTVLIFSFFFISGPRQFFCLSQQFSPAFIRMLVKIY